MYLFGDSYFEISSIKNVFQIIFIFSIIAEMLIWIFTSWKSRSHSGNQKGDKCSYLLIVAGYISIIFLNLYCRKKLLYVLPVMNPKSLFNGRLSKKRSWTRVLLKLLVAWKNQKRVQWIISNLKIIVIGTLVTVIEKRSMMLKPFVNPMTDILFRLTLKLKLILLFVSYLSKSLHTVFEKFV